MIDHVSVRHRAQAERFKPIFIWQEVRWLPVWLRSINALCSLVS
ncbi:hypothetical protein BN439_0971 [Erwinia amylovora Ea644]|nr:hypothetical protein BN439_0971 [Erwinia amylovora Ea644]